MRSAKDLPDTASTRQVAELPGFDGRDIFSQVSSYTTTIPSDPQ
jgi:hypothetical protein